MKLLFFLICFFLLPSTNLYALEKSYKCLATHLNKALKLAKVTSPKVIVSPRPIGVEIEGIIHYRTGKKGLIDSTYKILKKKYSKVTLLTNGITYEKNNTKYFYKFAFDSSIKVREKHGEVGVELVSPILRDNEDREIFLKVVKALEKQGFDAKPETIGTHIHVDASEAEYEQIKSLIAGFTISDQKLKKAFSVAKEREEQWAQILNDNELEQLFSPNTNIDNFFEMLKTRYRSINIKAFEKFKTIEFRIFNSTLNTKALSLMMEFTEKYTRYLLKEDPKLLQYLADTKPEDIDLFEIAKILEMDVSRYEKVFKTLAQELNRSEMNRFLTDELGPIILFAVLINSATFALNYPEEVVDFYKKLNDLLFEKEQAPEPTP